MGITIAEMCIYFYIIIELLSVIAALHRKEKERYIIIVSHFNYEMTV